MNPYEWLPGHQPRPRLQTLSTAYPGGGAPKKSWRSQTRFFRQYDRPHSTRTEGSTQNTKDTLETSIATPPSPLRGWHFRAPSAHARDAESDSFLACDAENKRRIRGVSDPTRKRIFSIQCQFKKCNWIHFFLR